MGLLETALRPPDPSDPSERTTDWVFLAFVAFALVMSGVTLVQRTRLRNALRLATVCLAQADPQCAREAVEAARALDEADLRVRLATIDLAVLQGEVARAASALDTLSQDALKTPLRPAERGDLLLTQGDLASARGDARRAKEEYDAAALLVDASALVRPRVDRLAEADRQRRVLLAALFGDLDLLLRAAENGDANAVTSRGAELAPRIATLGNKDAEAKLSSAVAAAQRVVMRPRGAGVDVDALVGARPRAPVRSAAQTPEADALYEAQHAAYVEAIAEWERKRTEAERARQEQSAAAPAAGELSLDEARKQIDEVRSALEAGSGPPP